MRLRFCMIKFFLNYSSLRHWIRLVYWLRASYMRITSNWMDCIISLRRTSSNWGYNLIIIIKSTVYLIFCFSVSFYGSNIFICFGIVFRLSLCFLRLFLFCLFWRTWIRKKTFWFRYFLNFYWKWFLCCFSSWSYVII